MESYGRIHGSHREREGEHEWGTNAYHGAKAVVQVTESSSGSTTAIVLRWAGRLEGGTMPYSDIILDLYGVTLETT